MSEHVHSVSAAELAEWLGVSERSVRDFAKAGTVVRAAKNAYALQPSIRAYVEHLRGVASGRAATADLADLRRREALARAERYEIANAKSRGELVPAAEFERAWTAAYKIVRNHLLAVPARVRQALPTLTAHDVDTIDREVRAALTEASKA